MKTVLITGANRGLGLEVVEVEKIDPVPVKEVDPVVIGK